MDVGEVHEQMVEIEENLTAMVADKFIEPEMRDTAKLCLVAGLFGCKNIDELAFRAGLSRDRFVRPRARRMRQSGLWLSDGSVVFEKDPDTDPTGTNIEFLLHVMCAEGLVECTERGGEPTAAGEVKAMSKFERLFAWRCESLPKSVTAEILVENLSCEGLGYNQIPADFRDDVVAFRHLTTVARIATARRYLASLV